MKRVFAALGFLCFYLWEVLVANFRIAVDILTPRQRMRPRFIQVRLDPLTSRQLLVLTNVLTMTPGTLCVEVSDDGQDLLVHSLYSESDDELIRIIKEDYERRVRNVF